MQAVIWSFFPHFGYIILRSFIAGHSRPRAAVVIMIAGFFVNAAGNYLLMFGAFGLPRLELVGLGLSTSFAHWFMFAALLGFCLVDRQFRRYGILVRGRTGRAFARSFASVCRSALAIWRKAACSPSPAF